MSASNPNHATTFFILFFFFISSFQLSDSVGNTTTLFLCPEIEKESLLSFKQFFKDPENQLSSWDGEVINCCKWKGVICNYFTGHVHQLHLPNMHLDGKSNPSLLNLKYLRYLNLSGNYLFGGTTPSFIGSFANLEYLNLSHTGVQGKVPHTIGNLSNLHTLDLEDFPYRGLEADSLEWLTGLSRLEYLYMDFVNLSATYNWAHVITVDVASDVITFGTKQVYKKFDCWVKWPSLIYLNLGNNNMPGSIPNSIGHLAALQSLNLYGNRLSGAIPFSMHNCTELVKIDFRDNDLDGGLPTWVGTELLKLTFLVLGTNKLSGSISSEPSKEVNSNTEPTPSLVTNINLSKNNLFGDIPKELTSLAELRSLNLSRNRLTGSIPKRIGDMKQLESLDLSINSVSGEIPSSYTLLTSLNHLNLSHNNLTRRIPKSTQLQSLDASSFTGNNLCGSPSKINCRDDDEEPRRHKDKNNEDEGSKIEGFYVLLSLGYAVGFSLVYEKVYVVSAALLNNVYLMRLCVRFEINPSLLNLKYLKHLDLSRNTFSGETIPSFIGSFPNLEYLNLSGSEFRGKIPRTIGNLLNLHTLDLKAFPYRGLEADSLEWLTGLSRLEYLNMDFVNLSAAIPDWFYLCKDMNFVDLSLNNLSGTISNSVANLTSLNTLRVTSNQLSGKIPKEIVNLCKIQSKFGKLSSLEKLLFHGNKFTGALPESFGLLSNLQQLHMNDNMLEGVVTEAHFANLTKLEDFFAPGNYLTLNVSPNWNPPFNLTTLQIASWNLGVGSQIPAWLETQTNIVELDLANTGISGSIPSWIWNVRILTLSHNHLSGKIPYLHGPKNQYIYLGSNQFSGGNQLSGELPDCWMKWPSLIYLNLGNNNMSGSIPNSIGHLAALQFLNLYGNRLYGAIPFSMHNCTELVKMDFSDNHLDGGLPRWVGTELLKLTFLVLGSN
ncbi:hypothetical protein ACS0TY_036655 [Phlomoides rotata]